MNDILWKLMTFRLWHGLFFRLSKIEKINDMHTRYVYAPRSLKNFWSIKQR